MGVVEATENDLAEIRKRAPDLADSALAATALALAREMDAHNSATSKSMCARALMDALEQLRALAPAKATADRIDEVNAKREDRRRRRASA